MEKETNEVLRKYVADTGVHSVANVEIDFDRVAQALPAEHLTQGLSEALRSEQTESFEQLVGQSFEQSNAEGRAAVLNQLLDAGGPAAMQTLQRVLPEPSAVMNAAAPSVTTEQAEKVDSHTVQQIAYLAQQDNPQVIDRISNYFAEDPAQAKTLGVATLNITLEKIARQQ